MCWYRTMSALITPSVSLRSKSDEASTANRRMSARWIATSIAGPSQNLLLSRGGNAVAIASVAKSGTPVHSREKVAIPVSVHELPGLGSLNDRNQLLLLSGADDDSLDVP